ncbi:MAG: cation diffusion facilitator family transporter [Pseudomonadota bacterium]
MGNCAHHQAAKKADGKRLLAALAITFIFMVVEIVGGLVSHSLALVADAAHMFTDVFALALAASAHWLSHKPATNALNFGYSRVQVLSGFVNGILLLILIAWIFIEAIQRLATPEPVAWSTMIVVASLGLVANGMAFRVLTQGNHDNINIRGAVLHVMGDLLGSVAAILAALVIMATGWMQIDPLLSILVGVLIARSAVSLVRESAHILLEGAPTHIDADQLVSSLKSEVRDIVDIHQVQLWQITPEEPRLTMHVAVRTPGEAAGTLRQIKAFLDQHYHGLHSTIQVEPERHCADASVKGKKTPASTRAKALSDVGVEDGVGPTALPTTLH